MTKRCSEEGKQGCHTKSYSWFNDEGVQLAVRECISFSLKNRDDCQLKLICGAVNYFAEV